MSLDDQIQAVLGVYYQGLACKECGASVRIGEYECAHCGTDFEELLREWSGVIINELEARCGLDT